MGAVQTVWGVHGELPLDRGGGPGQVLQERLPGAGLLCV